MTSAAAATTREMQELRAKFNVVPAEMKVGRPKNIMVIGTEYITDPYLCYPRGETEGAGAHGYKFHVRVHIIAMRGKNGASAAMLPTVRVITAGKPYRSASYSDPGIHDTHEKSNLADGMTLAEMDPSGELDLNLVIAMKELMTAVRPLIKKYDEVEELGYGLLGVDVMFREDKSAVVLEINEEPAIGGDDDAHVGIRKEVTRAIYIVAVAPVFGLPLSQEDVDLRRRLVRVC